MAWNPDTYNKYRSERAAPFYDLLELVQKRPGMKVIDLGCGTGRLTADLNSALHGSNVLGIDSSAEMLKEAKAFTSATLTFEQRTIEEQVARTEKYDLVFSNAAIQWVDDHEKLLPRMIAMLNPGGQLAVQLPAQKTNITNRLLEGLAAEEPFHTALRTWNRTSPVLDIETYARITFKNGANKITAFEKIYPLILDTTDALFDWVSGTALIPYIERLEGSIRDSFINRFMDRLKDNFTTSPVFYPFKRILLHASFD